MANAIRALSMDAVQAAESGHPGMPMGMADVGTVLFTRFLKFDPKWPQWPDRDRFVLSAGHGSMLLYSLLYLTGYDNPTIDEIKRFRQLGSPCAGHPEHGELAGVETTTGPLGQGLAMSVGMALAERLDAARHGDAFSNHYTYVIAGDGCLMEGISHEAISLAGHLKLGKLILLWDDNSISIDGPTDLTVSDNQAARFAASGWHTLAVDGHDAEAVAKAIEAAKADDRPSMIACKTIIGFGSPNKAGTSGVHGSPLGAAEVAAAREQLGWPYPAFEIPDEILNAWRDAGKRSEPLSTAWKTRFDALPADTRAEIERRLEGRLPAGFNDAIVAYKAKLVEAPAAVATRKASQNVLEVINPILPETIGGSADLTGSNNTLTKGMGIINRDDFSGRYMYWGVREFGMAAAMNGLALAGGYIPYGGTFLVFTDYCRPAIRLSALMKQRVVYVMTHDSIGLGEDGPTHQPIEHLAALRAMPNVNVFRPADAVETAECWALALASKNTPSVLALTRQNLPLVRLRHTSQNLSAKGAYELRAADGQPKATLFATGSEVEIALKARDMLQEEGIGTRVVSMPCCELFDAQDEAYRTSILGKGTIKLAIEAASPYGWERYVGRDGIILGIDSFGASAPAPDLYKHFGLTAEAIVDSIKERV